MSEENKNTSPYFPEELIYDIMEIPLDATLEEREFHIIAKYIFVLQIPITVQARINDMENPRVDLASVRAVKGNITKLYITTTSTSATSLKILASNSDFFSLLSFGDVVKLIDPSSVEYDARLSNHDVQTLYDDRPADANAHDSAIVVIQTFKSFVITVDNGLNENVDIKYYVSSDQVNWFQLGTTTTVATTAQDYETLTEAWSYLKVNYESAGIAISGDLTIKVERRS